MRIEAKFSAGNDCLRFFQVISGNLPAPSGNLGEVFCGCQGGFFQHKGKLLLSSIKQLDKNEHLLSLK